MYTLTQICGELTTSEKFSEINSEGIIIFSNDPNYQGVQLWNKLNKTVYVNSYEECEHYYLGGYDSTQQYNLELYSRIILIVLLTTLIVAKHLKKFLRNETKK